MIYSYKSNILRKQLTIKLPFSKYVQTPRKQIENHNKLTDIYTMLFFPVQTLSDTYSDYNRYNFSQQENLSLPSTSKNLQKVSYCKATKKTCCWYRQDT